MAPSPDAPLPWEELAGELTRRVRSGGDERELRTAVANALRVKKRRAAEVVDEFQRGYHAGIHAALAIDGDPPEGGPLWREAFRHGEATTVELRATVRSMRSRRQEEAEARTRGQALLLVVTALLLLALGVAIAW